MACTKTNTPKITKTHTKTQQKFRKKTIFCVFRIFLLLYIFINNLLFLSSKLHNLLHRSPFCGARLNTTVLTFCAFIILCTSDCIKDIYAGFSLAFGFLTFYTMGHFGNRGEVGHLPK